MLSAFLGYCHGDFGSGEFGPGANLFLGILLCEHQYFAENIDILDRCRASGERDLSDRMAFWPAQLNAALRCMANSITVLWLS